MNKLALATLLMIGSILVASLEPSEAAAPETITIADVGASATHWPAYAAMEEGYFKENGIDLEYIRTSSSAAGLQQLAAGSVDMASAGPPDSLRAIDKGAPITLLRIEEGPAPYQVYAKPNIHSYADLKGKEVMLGGIKDITRIYFERMATPNGLPPGTYDMIFAGATASRLAALLSGSIDATILNPPSIFKAQAANFSYLPPPADYSTGIPFTDLSVNTTWAKSHQPLIAKFLAAYAKGVDWFHDPANREKAVDILVQKLSVDRDDAEKAYDFYVSLNAFDRTGAVTEDSVETLLPLLKAQGDIDGPADFSRFYKPDVIGVRQ